jgi:outer membrane protein OmpA-like peptidoglycan-associated protein
MAARHLLLAGTLFTAFTALAVALATQSNAIDNSALAQQTAPDDKTQPPSAKGKQQPAAKGQPPATKGQPPAAQGQPPAAKGPPSQAPAATGQSPAQPQRPASKERPPATQGQASPPAAQEQTPPAAKGQPPTAKPGQPPQRPAAKGQPAQPPATQQQTPAQGQTPPAAQQPSQPRPPAAQGQPVRPQPPAARNQPVPPAAQQPVQQAPAAQGQPAQPQPPAAQGQPQPLPPAAQQPGQALPPAAQRPGQPQPPAAQGAPAQPPAVQAQPSQPQRPMTPGVIAPLPTGAQGQPLRRVDELRAERREERQGDRIVIHEPDRIIIREGGQTIIRHNEVDRFRYGGGREIAVERRGSETTTVVERPDGTRIITVVDESGRLIRRVRRAHDGREIVIIDNRYSASPGGAPGVVGYYVDLPPPVVRIPRERYIVEAEHASREDIYATLIAPPVERIDRRYSLDEVRYSPRLRERMPRIDVDSITFDSGSWELTPDQVARLEVIAEGINQAIVHNGSEVFLIEGHTDAVGSDVDNLSLSDRRAEAVAIALSHQAGVPAENLTTQGYGEQYLKVPTDGPERQNRRVTVRRITPLLTGQEQSTGQAN